MNTTEIKQWFSPLIAEWFSRKYHTPTNAQKLVWQQAASDEHMLLTSPTGTGKTLAAFLTAIDRLISGVWPAGQLTVLYISPLKALNRDVQLNLLTPLKEIQNLASEQNITIPSINIETRSGDTSAYRRRKILSHPPEILITTPESLNMLISTVSGYALFSQLKCVILDEIHNLAGSKRGTHLITAVERIVPLSGEFQRIGLSATIGNPETMRDFMGGFIKPETPRTVRLLRSEDTRTIELKVDTVPAQDFSSMEHLSSGEKTDTIWKRLAGIIRPQLSSEKSTLVFVNSRRLAEKLTYLINLDSVEPVAYAHHGSLSREIRLLAEERLKSGRLKCLVATNSLELGIDIGDLDHIILVQTPMSLSSAFQKLGRAGHAVGGISRGTLYCTHGRDLLAAAALCSAIDGKIIESTIPPENSLDVLSQIIVSHLVRGENDLDNLYATLKKSWPYRNLAKEEFLKTEEMLRGFYQGIKIQNLPVFILDTDQGTSASPAARGALFSSGGTIPDRGYYTLKHAGNGSLIGELDEEFVWERKTGDIFGYASRRWRIVSINSQVMEVLPTSSPANSASFFIAEQFLAGPEGYSLTRDLLDRFSADINLRKTLETKFSFTPDAAEGLQGFIEKQSRTAMLPGHNRIISEYTRLSNTGNLLEILFIHTFRGGKINAPLGLILHKKMEKSGNPVSVSWDNDSILIVSPEKLPRDIFSYVSPEDITGTLVEALSGSGIYGTRFREAAGRSLILARDGFGRRTPLWLSRLRAKRLYSSLHRFPGFPLLMEAAHECLEQQFDLQGLRNFLQEIKTSLLDTVVVETDSPSPFCSAVLWQQVNAQIYSDDVPENFPVDTKEWAERISSGEFLKPAIKESVIDDFLKRLRRTAPEYRPLSAADLESVVLERQYISISEFKKYAGFLEKEYILKPDGKIGSFRGWVASGDRLSRLKLPDNSDELYTIFIAWFYYAGPFEKEEFSTDDFSVSPFEKETALRMVERALDEGLIIEDRLGEAENRKELISREAYEQLLRFARGRNRSAEFNSLNVNEFAEMFAGWQTTERKSSILDICLQYEGLAIKKSVWDTIVFPLRTMDYKADKVDDILHGRELFFIGGTSDKRTFWHLNDNDLRTCPPETAYAGSPVPHRGAYNFWEISSEFTGTNAELAALLKKYHTRGVLCSDTWNYGDNSTESKKVRPDRKDFSRWQQTLPIQGSWFQAPFAEPGNSLEELEKAKERVRILFDRYPVLFREMLYRETRPFRWMDIFQALRLMEFSGEVISGNFINAVPGLQFIQPQNREKLQFSDRQSSLRLLHVQDPASLSGIPLNVLKDTFPPRRGDLWYIMEAGTMVLSYAPNKGNLQIYSESSAEKAFHHLCAKMISTHGLPDKIQIRQINNESAALSPYLSLLEKNGFSRGYKEYTLWNYKSS